MYFCTAATNQLGFFDTISPTALHSFSDLSQIKVFNNSSLSKE